MHKANHGRHREWCIVELWADRLHVHKVGHVSTHRDVGQWRMSHPQLSLSTGWQYPHHWLHRLQHAGVSRMITTWSNCLCGITNLQQWFNIVMLFALYFLTCPYMDIVENMFQIQNMHGCLHAQRIDHVPLSHTQINDCGNTSIIFLWAHNLHFAL